MIKFNLFSTFFFVSLACLPHWIWVCFLISFGLLDRGPQVCRKPDWDTTHLAHDVETQQTQVHSITRWSKAKRRGHELKFLPFQNCYEHAILSQVIRIGFDHLIQRHWSNSNVCSLPWNDVPCLGALMWKCLWPNL